MRLSKNYPCLHSQSSGGLTPDAANPLGAGNCGDFIFDTYFPPPAVQAMFLLDETEDDPSTAIALALTIAKDEDIGDVKYWVAVADALTLNEQEN